MAEISDDYMRQMLQTTREYSLVILHAGPNYDAPTSPATIWEHGRNNFSMRADGLLSIVCPVTDQGAVRGVGIFNAGVDAVTRLMEDDPGVQTGVFTYEVHPCRSFPGDALPT